MPAGETTTEDLLGLVRGVRDQQQRATRDRPPPTSYRDEQERWHPGPGAPGYREHMVACEPCLAHFIRAGANGEAWALAMPPVVQACRLSREPIAIPGPGMSRESLALLPLPRLEARSTTAGAVGCLAGVLLAAVLPLGVATVVALALLVATLAGARVWGADRVPTARWLRR